MRGPTAPCQHDQMPMIPRELHEVAYEVYTVVYGQQPALVDYEKGCRGGFGCQELAILLYAASAPRSAWREIVIHMMERGK